MFVTPVFFLPECWKKQVHYSTSVPQLWARKSLPKRATREAWPHWYLGGAGVFKTPIFIRIVPNNVINTVFYLGWNVYASPGPEPWTFFVDWCLDCTALVGSPESWVVVVPPCCDSQWNNNKMGNEVRHPSLIRFLLYAQSLRAVFSKYQRLRVELL